MYHSSWKQNRKVRQEAFLFLNFTTVSNTLKHWFIPTSRNTMLRGINPGPVITGCLQTKEGAFNFFNALILFSNTFPLNFNAGSEGLSPDNTLTKAKISILSGCGSALGHLDIGYKCPWKQRFWIQIHCATATKKCSSTVYLYSEQLETTKKIPYSNLVL